MTDDRPTVNETLADLDKVTASPISGPSASQSPVPEPTLSCEMCQNYELNLTMMQDNERKLTEELKAVKILNERYLKDLSDERNYRVELDKKTNDLAVLCEERAIDAEKNVKSLEDRLSKMMNQQKTFTEQYAQSTKQAEEAFSSLQKEMEDILKKYQRLLGVHRSTASQMRSEVIDLPSDPEQLMFACLQLREELIESKSARQHIETELTDEVQLAREQLIEEQKSRSALEQDLMEQVNELQTKLGIANSQLTDAGNAVLEVEEQQRQIRELQHTIGELEEQVKQVQGERAAVEKTAQNYKIRCSSLQGELDTSEAVQKDFVKLSQSLQIQLEKIRQSEMEVRWQWEDDVDHCSGCEATVAKLRPKPRCLHCCKIFCANCVRTTVPSGPNRRPAPVCQVCHTLLNRNSAPFFAQDSSQL